MSVTIVPARSSKSKVPITSQVPLGYGAFYKVNGPLEPGTILDSVDSYKKYLADETPDKYCIIYNTLYIGLDTRMDINLEVIHGHGNVDNRMAASREFNHLVQSNQEDKISKRSIPGSDWEKIVDSNQLVKLT